jgi:hypothetical protein
MVTLYALSDDAAGGGLRVEVPMAEGLSAKPLRQYRGLPFGVPGGSNAHFNLNWCVSGLIASRCGSSFCLGYSRSTG